MKLKLAQLKYAIIGVLVIILTFGVKRLHDFAKTPISSKNCIFTYPTLTGNTTTLSISGPEWLTQHGGFTNDASCLNRTPIYGVRKIKTEQDIADALTFAEKNNLPITAAGQKHSMGGQSFKRQGLVLDMRPFNQIEIDTEKKIAYVQSGATWEELQTKIDPLGLSIQAMQSINIFTIGGTISVNAHGIAHNPGSVASTIRSMRVMLPDGSITYTSPAENPELFRHVIGGYGLFGIILEVEIQLVDNQLYKWNTTYMPYTEFPAYFKSNIEHNPEIGLFYGRLSMNPFSYLTETAVHTFTKTDAADIPPLTKPESAWMQRLIFNLSKTGKVGKWLRWNLEKYIGKKIAPCTVERNTALIDQNDCLLARNQAMYDSMSYLKNNLADTDILQEYFISPEEFPEFVDGLRSIVTENEVNLLNVTVRYVHKDEITALPYAKENMFALVLYFNQHFNETESKILEQTTKQLIDLVLKYNGTYYLPYQLYYSPEQLHAAYPEIDEFFETKKIYDPKNRLQNTWFEKYRTN